MRQQALLLIAAVSLYVSATAQQTHFFPKLSLMKSYDVANINKSSVHPANIAPDRSILKTVPTTPQLSPRLDFTSLQQQLGKDIQYLKLEKRNQQWQGLFQGMAQGALYNKDRRQ